MGHYSECYDRDYEEERLAKKANLEMQLKDLTDFYMWKPDRVRTWSWNGKVSEIYREMLKQIKAELYDLQ